MKCTNGYEVEVLKSGAGYYIGTWDELEGPNCRLSVQYYAYKADAELALKLKTFTCRSCIENDWCNGGCGCLKGEN